MLEGKNVRLTITQEKHLDQLYSNILKVGKRGEYFPLGVTPEPIFRSNFRKDGFWGANYRRLLVFNKSDNLVGSIYCFTTLPYSDALEIGFIVFDPESRGKGYMSESLQLFTDYLFSSQTVYRIDLKIHPGNIPSIKVTEKAGYEFESCMKGVIYIDGKHQDLNVYALTRDKWEAR